MLPEDWEEYETDEESTYAFFNSKEWTGNFRISPYRWINIQDENEDKAADFILEHLSENNKANKIKLGNWDCAYYKEDILLEDGDRTIIYYWIAGKKENLFVCSFTINNEIEQTEQEQSEIKIVEDIIMSIEIK